MRAGTTMKPGIGAKNFPGELNLPAIMLVLKPGTHARAASIGADAATLAILPKDKKQSEI
jgi:hypothetical protein